MSSKRRCGSNRAREAKQGARTPTHVEEVLPRAALRTAARTGPGRGRGVLGVHVGGGFSCRVHRCAPFWGAVGVHGPCNEKTSLAAPDDNTVHAFTVKAPSVSQRRSFRLYPAPRVTCPLPTLSHTLLCPWWGVVHAFVSKWEPPGHAWVGCPHYKGPELPRPSRDQDTFLIGQST